jgi:Cu/Ag efflux pump CusA
VARAEDDHGPLRGNPFARALFPIELSQRGPLARLVLLPLSLVVFLLLLSAMLLPLALCPALLYYGLRDARWGMTTLGALLALLYLFAVASFFRKRKP